MNSYAIRKIDLNNRDKSSKRNNNNEIILFIQSGVRNHNNSHHCMLQVKELIQINYNDNDIFIRSL